MTSWPTNYFNWGTTFRTADAPSANGQLAVELSSVELSCVALYTSTTQLNSTRRRVELSCVATNGALVTFSRATVSISIPPIQFVHCNSAGLPHMLCYVSRVACCAKAPFIATQLNSTQLNCQLSIRRRRVSGSERRDPVEVVCESWRYVWCKIATKFANLCDCMTGYILWKVGQKN